MSFDLLNDKAQPRTTFEWKRHMRNCAFFVVNNVSFKNFPAMYVPEKQQ